MTLVIMSRWPFWKARDHYRKMTCAPENVKDITEAPDAAPPPTASAEDEKARNAYVSAGWTELLGATSASEPLTEVMVQLPFSESAPAAAPEERARLRDRLSVHGLRRTISGGSPPHMIKLGGRRVISSDSDCRELPSTSPSTRTSDPSVLAALVEMHGVPLFPATHSAVSNNTHMVRPCPAPLNGRGAR